MNNRQTKNGKIFYISYLAVLSAISVVILHGSIYRYAAGNPSKFWFVSNFIMCFFFFAVPIFYMISGATLMDYRSRYDTKTYFMKRAKKVVIPFCFWLVVLCLFRIYFMKIPLDENIILYLYNSCIEGSLYWFFIPLFAIYLVIPLLNYVPRDRRIKMFTFYAVIIFAFSSVMPFLMNNFHIHLAIRPDFMFTSGLFIYPLLGYVLNEVDLSRKYRLVFYILGILGLLAMFVPTQMFYQTHHEATYIFKSYTYPTTVLYSIAVWIFSKQLCKNPGFVNGIRRIVEFVNPYTFGIYLIHYYFIEMIAHYSKWNIQSISFSLLIPVIVIPLAILTLYVLKRIPLVRNVVP